MEQNETCNFEENAVLYAYGELPDSEKMYFEEHLSKCHLCAGKLAVLKAAEHTVSAEVHNPSESTVRFIIAKSDEYFRPAANKYSFRKKLAALCLSVIIVLSGLAIISGGSIYGHQLETASISGDEMLLGDVFQEEEIELLEDEISSEMDLWE